MTASEARRRDLYHGLEEVLGTDRADTLMAYLPVNEAASLATKDDLAGVETRLQDEFQIFRTDLREEFRTFRTELRDEFQDFRTEVRGDLQTFRTDYRGDLQTFRTGFLGEVQSLRTEAKDDLRAVHDRLDRLFQTLAAGLIAVVGAVVTAFFIG